MPNYDFKCNHCNKTTERYVSLKDFDLPQYCKCSRTMKRLISKKAIQTDGAKWLRDTTEFLKDGEEEVVYNDPVTSRKEYNRLLKEKGLIPVG